MEGSGTLTLESGNAQLDTQAEPQGNPAGESFELCAWEDDIQAYTVGQEIPAGVYDVNWNQGSGFLGWDTQSSYHLTYYGGDGFNGRFPQPALDRGRHPDAGMLFQRGLHPLADPGCGNLRVKKQHAAANGPLCEGNSPHRGEMSRSDRGAGCVSNPAKRVEERQRN